MSNKTNNIPQGTLYRDYLDEARTDNEYIINYNINNIRYLYDHVNIIETFINNLPDVSDLSGYYTKEQTDLLLDTKLDKSLINPNAITQSGSYDFTEQASPSIKKVDLNGDVSSELRILTTGIHYLKQNHELTFADEIIIRDELDTVNNNLDSKINDNTDKYYQVETRVDTLEANQTNIFNDINELETNVNQNSNDIISIKSELNASFETNGEYQHIGGTLSPGTIYRPNLIEITPLENTFVNVVLEPNSFQAIVSGRTIFTNIYDNISVDNDLTLTFRIYKNDTVFKEIDKTLIAGSTYGTTIVGALDLEEGDVVYVEYEITAGTGTITAASNTTFIIQFKSTDDVSAIKTSQIINDSDVLPNNGLNPTLLSLQQQIDQLKLPVGSIVIGLNPPNYGDWIDVGELQDGQAIIGGSSNTGSVKKHNHLSFTGVYYGNADDKSQINFFTRLTGYDENGKLKNIRSGTDEENLISNSNLFTSNTGNDKNQAWGLGLGNGNHLWKRTN